MNRIDVPCSQGDYQVLVGHDLLGRLGTLLDEVEVKRPAAVISNTVVGPLYARDTAADLQLPPPFELPDGEVYKRWAQVEAICASLLERGVHRGDTVLGMGGGVTTDMVGFAAAVYLRGIDWVAVPTTLLAMVDASVGGKTGVNLDQGKNLVGCFWHPRLVVADVDVLATLPERELRAGLAEVVKSAWIADRELLEEIDRPVTGYGSYPSGWWQELVTRTVRVKAEVVRADERETGWRQSLNLGHTIGHALEAATAYRRFLHGEAVAWGLLGEAALARRHDLLSADEEMRLRRAVTQLTPLPKIVDIPLETILEHLVKDKKKDDLGVAWALPSDTGAALGQRVELTEVEEVIRTLKEH